jgi:hypothetical protein
METVCLSETLASTNQSARRLNPEEHHHFRHCRESLKSQPLCCFTFFKTITVTEFVTFFKIYYHTSLQGAILCGSSTAPFSQVQGSTMFLLLS